MTPSRPTRRELLGTAAGLSVLPIFPPSIRPGQAASPGHGTEVLPATTSVAFHLNGEVRTFDIEPRTTLLDLLREQTEHTGTKKGCDLGACGACTVLLDGNRVLACLTLAARCRDKAITTIEGLATGDDLHPMQAAFLHHDAFQCGYCTPGQIISAVALVKEGHTGSDEEIREWMSGNICRCGAYPNIVAAIREVAPIERKA